MFLGDSEVWKGVTSSQQFPFFFTFSTEVFYVFLGGTILIKEYEKIIFWSSESDVAVRF